MYVYTHDLRCWWLPEKLWIEDFKFLWNKIWPETTKKSENEIKGTSNLSKSQLRSLYLSLNSEVAVNNLPTGLRLGKDIDSKTLEEAFNHFLLCHPILTSRLELVDDEYTLNYSKKYEYYRLDTTECSLDDVSEFIVETLDKKYKDEKYKNHIFNENNFIINYSI